MKNNLFEKYKHTTLTTSVLFLLITCFCIFKGVTNQYVFITWILSMYFILKYFGISLKNNDFISNLKIFDSKAFFILILIYLIPRIILLIIAPTLRIHHDETILSYNAFSLFTKAVNEHSLNMLGGAQGPVSVFPSLWYCIQGAFLYFFGYNFYSAKIFSLVTDFCIFSCLWFYGIKFLNSKKISFVSCFIYATFFPAVYYSNVILNNLQSSLFYFLVLILLIMFQNKFNIKSENSKIFLVIGLVTGFSLYFYLSSIAMPIYVVSYVIYSLCLSKIINFRNILSKFNYFLCGYIFSSLPFWIYSIFFNNFLGGRINNVDVTKYYKEDFFGFFKTQLVNIILGFYTRPFNGAGMHYLNLSLFDGKFLLVIFLIGFLMSFIYFKRKEIFIFQIFFMLTIILGGLMTVDPPASQRLLPILWIIPFFCGISICKISELIEKYVIKKIGVKYFFISVALLIATFECNVTFKRAVVNSRDLKDVVLGFIPIYKNEKLPIYSIVPMHFVPMLSFYMGDHTFSINSLFEADKRERILKDKEPHYFIYFIQDRSNVFDKNALDLDTKYEKVNMLNPDGKKKNKLYRCYKLKKH